jgi:hypothetical protein
MATSFDGREYVAVTHLDLHVPSRRDVLLFDRIALGGLGHPRAAGFMGEQTRAELEYLEQQGVLFDPGICFRHLCDEWLPFAALSLAASVAQWALEQQSSYAVSQLLQGRDPNGNVRNIIEDIGAGKIDPEPVLQHTRELLMAAIATRGDDMAAAIGTLTLMAAQLSTRLRAHGLWENDTPAAPLLPDVFTSDDRKNHMEVAVVDLVMKNLPVLDDDVPWEDVIGVRSELRHKQHDLHRWMRKISNTTGTVAELRDEFDQMLSDYSRFYEVHRLKTRRSVLQAVLAIPLGALAGVAGAALGAFVDLRERKSAIMEAELNAPGRPVAYIIEARYHFAP